MWYYVPIVFIPALLVMVFIKVKFHHHVTLKEFGLQIGGLIVGTLVGILLISISSIGLSGDFAIFNGYVTDKEYVKVPCSHEYKCGENCYMVTETDAQGKKTQRQQCDPIYCDEHDYDISWRVNTTLGTWKIDRIDRQGLKMPPRWDIAYKGEPVSESRYVTNYLLLNRDRYNTSETIRARYHNVLMDYPRPYDYYRYNRLIQDNLKDYDAIKIWVSEKLKKDAAVKELNVLLVVTQNDADYYYALMEHWKGVRKNDVVLFYGVDDEDNLKWMRAMSFADGQSNLIMLKQLESMTYHRQFDINLVKDQYKFIIDNYTRLPNSTFKYLEKDWVPPTWWLIVVSLINFGFAVFVGWFVVKEDVA